MGPFFVLYLPDPEWQCRLDVIRLLCDPEVQGAAHLTVRGPYTSRPKENREWRKVRQIRVSVVGVDVFLGPNQSTVFLACESPDLRVLWWKKDYADGRPHITLYDGRSRDFALKVVDTLKRYEWRFDFLADQLHEFRSSQGQRRLDLNWTSYERIFHRLAGRPLTRGMLRHLTISEKLYYLDKLAADLVTVTQDDPKHKEPEILLETV